MTDIEILDALKESTSIRGAAAALGCARSTIERRALSCGKIRRAMAKANQGRAGAPSLGGDGTASVKVAVLVSAELAKRLDKTWAARGWSTRSEAVREALEAWIEGRS
mgnify:CR=1 FL=1